MGGVSRAAPSGGSTCRVFASCRSVSWVRSFAGCSVASRGEPDTGVSVGQRAAREADFFDPEFLPRAQPVLWDSHGEAVGGTGPDESLDRAGAVYEGSVPGRFGNRKPQSTSYAVLSPVLTLDAEGGVVGGNFWDGRATGWRLGSATADQAQGPPVNPLEQALPDGEEVTRRICDADYGDLFRSIYGAVACEDLALGYDQAADAVAAYEASSEVSPFSSRYDAWLAGRTSLTAQEAEGLALFEGKAGCTRCHLSQPGSDGAPPAFTDFTFENLGVPANPENPFYDMDRVFVDGEPINPSGRAWVDPGLGGFLEQLRSDETWRDLPFVSRAFLALSTEELARRPGRPRQAPHPHAPQRGRAARPRVREGLRPQRLVQELEGRRPLLQHP